MKNSLKDICKKGIRSILIERKFKPMISKNMLTSKINFYLRVIEKEMDRLNPKELDE